MTKDHIPLFLTVSMFEAIAVLLAAYFIYKFLRRYGYRKRARAAKRAEADAEKLLEKKGYEIIESQKRIPVRLKMDGEEFESFIIADYIVRKGSKTYVVEVKSQEIASRIYEPSVRRQLLEYFLTFKPDGVLLVDMSGKKIHRVEFIRAKDRSYLWLIFTIFILILIICLLILRN